MTTQKNVATWGDLKAELTDVDRAALLRLVQDLYALSKENQTFLHARFALGADVLQPYKSAIYRWLWPDGIKSWDTSVAKAKKAIADYKKAIGRPDGAVELMVFYCECASGFSNEVGLQDEGYFNALVRMFEHTLSTIDSLPLAHRTPWWRRLDAVRRISHNFGYGVGDDMDALLKEREIDD